MLSFVTGEVVGKACHTFLTAYLGLIGLDIYLNTALKGADSLSTISWSAWLVSFLIRHSLVKVENTLGTRQFLIKLAMTGCV